MRIAVIGAGRMGAIRAEDLVSGGAEVTLFNRRDNVAKELAQKLNCNSAEYADLLKLDFDGYVVATATNSHIAILEQLIPLGKPILCEKPISLTVEETDLVIGKCKKYGTEIKRLHPDFEYRFYTDEDMARLMKTEFPEYYDKFNEIPRMIMKRLKMKRLKIMYK